MSQFGSAVISLGEGTYPDAFAGAYASECDTQLTIALVPTAPDSNAFLAAVAARSTPETPYSEVDAPNSWTGLTELTTRLSSLTWTQWQSDGLDVRGFGPDVSTDTVLVTLESPTSDDLAALSSTATSVGIATAPVTPETYVAVAGQVLAALYGNAVGVATAYGIPLTLFDRFTDYSPFYGGDQIEYETSGGEAVCTGGFAVVALVGNRAGDDFMLSAGHCGDAAAWYLTGCQECSGDGTDMGWTSTIYFEDPARDDFQAILTQPIGASSAAGYVYGTGYTYYVEGVDNVGYGQPFTFDGSVTGEVRGATAGYSGLCEWFDKHTVEDCNLIEGTDTSTICQSGDSGGPTFVVNGNTGGVYAVGTIVGGASNDCFAETIGWEESASETALLLGT